MNHSRNLIKLPADFLIGRSKISPPFCLETIPYFTSLNEWHSQIFFLNPAKKIHQQKMFSDFTIAHGQRMQTNLFLSSSCHRASLLQPVCHEMQFQHGKPRPFFKIAQLHLNLPALLHISCP